MVELAATVAPRSPTDVPGPNATPADARARIISRIHDHQLDGDQSIIHQPDCPAHQAITRTRLPLARCFAYFRWTVWADQTVR